VASIDIAVDRITYVSSVDGCGEIVVEAQTVNTLSEAIQVVVLRQGVDKLNELVFVDEMRAFGREDGITRRLSRDAEPK
jgi:hypothetical protein